MKKVFLIAAMLILTGIYPAYAEDAVTFSETATGVICTINDTNGSFGRAMYTVLKSGAFCKISQQLQVINPRKDGICKAVCGCAECKG